MEVIYGLAFPLTVMLGGLFVFERVLWAFVVGVRLIRGVTGQPE